MIELYLTIACKHLASDNMNEVNPGVIVGYESVLVGGYKNSYSDMSYLAAKKFDWEDRNFEYGFLIGGVTGYEGDFIDIGTVTPFAAPFVSYDYHGIKPTVLLLGEAVTFSVGFEF